VVHHADYFDLPAAVDSHMRRELLDSQERAVQFHCYAEQLCSVVQKQKKEAQQKAG
jgi:hypothetical protein